MFTTERARAQVERILEYAGCFGIACILDADALVVAAVGALSGLDAEALAHAFGAREDPIIEGAVPHALPGARTCAYLSSVRDLPGDRRLVVVAPASVAVASDRIDRAALLLARMLAPRRSGPPEPPPTEHAAVWAYAGTTADLALPLGARRAAGGCAGPNGAPRSSPVLNGAALARIRAGPEKTGRFSMSRPPPAEALGARIAPPVHHR